MKLFIFWPLLVSIFTLATCVTPNQNKGTNETDLGMQRDLNDWSVLQSGTQCAIEEARQVLIKTEQDYANLWTEAFEGIDMAPERPAVDFTQKWVVAAFLGTLNKGGHEVNIQAISQTDNAAVITLLHTEPGANCMSTMAIEFPYLFAGIEQFPAGEVAFRTEVEKKDCN